MNSTHHYEQLIEIFNSCFADDFNTRLIKGDDEPIYLPADAEVPYNRIVFAHGFYASAIHEISHWCIAGKARRELVDFGYWYCPDGRDAQTQSQFEDVEVKPQALDWLFCVAAGYPFNVRLRQSGRRLRTGSCGVSTAGTCTGDGLSGKRHS